MRLFRRGKLAVSLRYVYVEAHRLRLMSFIDFCMRVFIEEASHKSPRCCRRAQSWVVDSAPKIARRFRRESAVVVSAVAVGC